MFDPFGDDEDPARAAVRDEMLDLLRELVETRLTDRQRQIVELYFTDGLTQEEIAAQLGIAQQVANEAALAMLESPRFLQSFVANGSKDEAVMATRALCGHMLVRVDGWLPSDVRRRVRDTYDAAPAAFGVPSCRIPRDDALALASEVGYPGPP